MKPFFGDLDRQEQFKQILFSWLGTPYRHQCMVKGRGADCSLFLGNALVEMGILDGMTYDYYPRDWHIHGTVEVFLNNFRANIDKHLSKNLEVTELSVSDPLMFGDWIGMSFRSTGVTNHSAIVIGQDRIIHSRFGKGVSIDNWYEYKNFHTITFRVMEK